MPRNTGSQPGAMVTDESYGVRIAVILAIIAAVIVGLRILAHRFIHS